MPWWRTWRRDGNDRAALRARVEDLESRLAFVNDRHGRLLAQEGEPMRENAVLRYDLQRCQRDRHVLEANLAGARGELRRTWAVPRRRVAAGTLREEALASAARALALRARSLGFEGAAVVELEARAAAREPERPAAVAAFVSACDELLDAFEAWRDAAIAAHARPADALASLDPDTEALRLAVVKLRRVLVDGADGG